MGRKRDDQIEESLIHLREASKILGISKRDIEVLIHDHRLTAYHLGDHVVRLRKDEVWELLSQARVSAELFPVDREIHHNVPVTIQGSAVDRVRDFFYFNDFYIISFVIIAALLYLILSSQ